MENALPAIPAKRYFTIGEVSDLCGVKPYVLRYWEQEFIQLKPMKRRGNRRYYQHHEVLLIRRIRGLLYDQGFTISGARNQLMEGGAARSDAAALVFKQEADEAQRLEDEAGFDDGDIVVRATALPGGAGASAGVAALAAQPAAARSTAGLDELAGMSLRLGGVQGGLEPLTLAQVKEELLAIRQTLLP